MRMVNRVEIKGPAERVYALAEDIARWPKWLPHYRWVRVLADNGEVCTAEMAALRNRFPCRWRADQRAFPTERRITYRHVGGVTRGMWVEWRIEERPDATHVSIVHDLDYPVPILGPLFAKNIVGRLFVHHIAERTLGCLKRKVESEVK